MGDRERALGDASALRRDVTPGRLRIALLLALCAGFLACSDANQDDGAATADSVDDAATAPGQSAPATGSAGGGVGYTEFINPLNEGLTQTGLAAAGDPAEALRLMQDLYNGVHQSLLQTYGDGGSGYAGDALAQAVTRFDVRMNELLQLLQTQDADAGSVADAVTVAQQTLHEVETEAIAAGIPPA